MTNRGGKRKRRRGRQDGLGFSDRGVWGLRVWEVENGGSGSSRGDERVMKQERPDGELFYDTRRQRLAKGLGRLGGLAGWVS